MTSRRNSDTTFAEAIKDVGFNEPRDVVLTWKALAAILTMVSNVESLYLMHGDGFDFNKSLSAELCVKHQLTTGKHQEYAFWRWMSGVQHVDPFGFQNPGAPDLPDPPGSAPCRRMLPRLKCVTLEGLRSGCTPPQIFASLFAHPRSLSRLELVGSLIPSMPESAFAAGRELREIRFDSTSTCHIGHFTDMIEAFPNLVTIEGEIHRPCQQLRDDDDDDGYVPNHDLDSWDPAELYQPPNLPSSLVKLHLIDFWGEEDAHDDDLASHPCYYYPPFPVGDPRDFYEHIILSISGEAMPNLRQINLSTDLVRFIVGNDEEFRSDSDDDDDDDDDDDEYDYDGELDDIDDFVNYDDGFGYEYDYGDDDEFDDDETDSQATGRKGHYEQLQDDPDRLNTLISDFSDKINRLIGQKLGARFTILKLDEMDDIRSNSKWASKKAPATVPFVPAVEIEDVAASVAGVDLNS
ncbi:hypothetical protein QBC34DRAFT_430750 [Podospora aff. communis PSN243]|uniref:F-box domain-containing protein n=1 Tax=Podospora aff. communis PSN243 TaxID=3040156 RepID=A0AAV9G632_9PEZI|nr:hypothetical protein QBC34DRAFT_430750 [Podospora aff. communis PSN243]